MSLWCLRCLSLTYPPLVGMWHVISLLHLIWELLHTLGLLRPSFQFTLTSCKNIILLHLIVELWQTWLWPPGPSKSSHSSSRRCLKKALPHSVGWDKHLLPSWNFSSSTMTNTIAYFSCPRKFKSACTRVLAFAFIGTATTPLIIMLIRKQKLKQTKDKQTKKA